MATGGAHQVQRPLAGVHGGWADRKIPSGLPSRLHCALGREKGRPHCTGAAAGGRAAQERQRGELGAQAEAARRGAGRGTGFRESAWQKSGGSRQGAQPAPSQDGTEQEAGRGRARLFAPRSARTPGCSAHRFPRAPRTRRASSTSLGGRGSGLPAEGPGDGVGARLTPVLRGSGGSRGGREGGRLGRPCPLPPAAASAGAGGGPGGQVPGGLGAPRPHSPRSTSRYPGSAWGPTDIEGPSTSELVCPPERRLC